MSRSTRSAATAVKPVESLTFEQALEELERVVAQLEGGGLTLEQALAAHRRGLDLARACQSRLDAAQQQVRLLEGESLVPFEAREGAGTDD